MRTLLFLSFPVWGTVIGTQLLISLGSYWGPQGNTPLYLIEFIGALLVIGSSQPIFSSPSLSTASKLALAALYLFLSTIVVVVLGALLFCLHRCN